MLEIALGCGVGARRPPVFTTLPRMALTNLINMATRQLRQQFLRRPSGSLLIKRCINISPSKFPHQVEKKKVLMLYTGGTMGMVAGKDGSLAPERGFLTQKILELPEFRSENMPEFTIKEYDPLLDSSCMGPPEWAKIATDVEDNYFDYDGFVVIMGTDTMAYASSALSFMLENLGKPVIFTGSQIPFFEVYNDARRNLIVSVIFAASSDFPEVCICFHDRLLRANRSVKIDSKSLLAFDSPNFPPLATLGAFINENKGLCLRQPTRPFKAHKTLEAKVVVLKLVPGFDDECILALVNHSKELRAIVLEMYGTGNADSSKDKLLEAIKIARAKGILVVAVSQCLRGGTSLDLYSMGKQFKDAGVVAAGDMTTEACTTKLAYLFGRLNNRDLVRDFLAVDIRGEISSGLEKEKKFFDDQVTSRLADCL